MLGDNNSLTAITTRRFEDLLKHSKLAIFKAVLCYTGLYFHHPVARDYELVRNESALERCCGVISVVSVLICKQIGQR